MKYLFNRNPMKNVHCGARPGETKQLRLTIENDYDSDIMHKLGFVVYTDDGDPINIEGTKEFTIRPVYDLRFTDFDVTPKEEVDDEYADYIVRGNRATVSGKIKNTEATDFVGAIIIRVNRRQRVYILIMETSL